jgi:hypothetical protein
MKPHLKIAVASLVLAVVLGGLLWNRLYHVGKNAGPKYPPLNTADYDRRMRILFHKSTSSVAGVSPVQVATAPAKKKGASTPGYPKAGAILPFRRVLAYYGNFHSKQMGILGEFDEAEVLRRLKVEAEQWNRADPNTPVLPAIHLVAVVAQAAPGADGKYRLRMSAEQLDRALRMGRAAGGITFFDIQIARSTVEAEVPRLDKYLTLPDVHLGLDPEFAMKGEKVPGRSIGTMDAREINWTIKHLSKLVDQYDLPPKILIIHRFVPQMVTNLRLIQSTPQVQVVIDMDGWGRPEDKKKTYEKVIRKDRVKLAGLKIFYKNDTRNGSRLMTPAEALELNPRPIYIQYQ